MKVRNEINNEINTVEQLRALYRPPSELATKKVQSTIDVETARFIELSPLMFLATTNSASVDISPRGGPAGFVRCIDEMHVAIPDLNGNNRLDSYENIVANPAVGMIFVVPGRDDTVRVNGTATLTTDPDLLATFTAELATPKMAVVVRVAEVFAHCSKALRRSQVWQPGSWDAYVEAPDLPTILATQMGYDAAELRASYAPSIDADLAVDNPTDS